MSLSGPLLLLTMPGFGIETLRHLVRDPAWPTEDVTVALVGARPAAWRRAAVAARRLWQRPADRVHRLAEGALAASDAERFLLAERLPWQWLADDNAVRSLRAALAPALTLTITSRILFSARTLAQGTGAWLNVHPGLLPEYAGASPGPYMFLDGVGGCTIHEMAARVDGGPIVDRAPIAEPLAQDGASFFFEQLPRHTALRVALLLGHWLRNDGRPQATMAAQTPLRHCSSRRLAADRQLYWCWTVERLARWVRALAGIAPAWWDTGRARRVEVMAAEPRATHVGVAPGQVLACQGRWVEVACGDGALALRCRSQPGVQAGERLPLRESSEGA